MIYNVYIPVPSENRELSRFVKQSISEQSLKTNIVVCHFPGEFNSQGIYTPLRCTGEAASRNLCRGAALLHGAEICFVIDKDMALGRENRTGFVTSVTLFETLRDVLQSDPTIGMVGCKNRAHPLAPGVIDIGICAWRVAAIPHFEPQNGTCLCPFTCAAVWKSGYKTVFVPNQIYTEV
jgi:hypothetical protein